MDFSGKSIILTGGSGAVGSAVVKRALEAGATVVCADLGPPRSEWLAGLGVLASRVDYQHTDVTSEASVRQLMEAAARHGGPHILLNVAGGFRYGPSIEETDEKDWDSMLQLNLKSTFLCIKHVLPYMKRQGYGRIVSVSARAGLKGDAMIAPYAVSKAGVIVLTQSVAEEVKDLGITVNCVLPSVVDTPANRVSMQDSDFTRWVAPEDMAEVILFLASEQARAVTGAALPVYHRA